jgi:hypothetical protein
VGTPASSRRSVAYLVVSTLEKDSLISTSKCANVAAVLLFGLRQYSDMLRGAWDFVLGY